MQMKYQAVAVALLVMARIFAIDCDAYVQPAGSSVDIPKVTSAISYSNLVFVGTVDEIGSPPPLIEQGFFFITQSVTYKVEQVLKGNYDKQVIRVDHKIVFGSRNSPRYE